MASTNSESQRATILIVDSEENVLECVASLLGYEGHHIISARQSSEALEACNSCQLIIAADSLEDMSGPELVRSLQRAGCKAPILYTLSPSADGVAAAAPAGVAVVMQKPLNGGLLLRKIAELLLPPEEEDDELAEAMRALKLEYIQALNKQVQAIGQDLSILQEDLSNQDAFTEAITYAHRIRGTAGSYGFPQVGLEAGVLEDLLKEVAQQNACSDWQPLMDAFHHTRQAAEKIIQNV